MQLELELSSGVGSWQNNGKKGIRVLLRTRCPETTRAECNIQLRILVCGNSDSDMIYCSYELSV
jgi:hypothetical protein